MDAEDDRQERRLNIHFSPEIMAGVYANFANVSHSEYEFTITFARIDHEVEEEEVPGVVVSRVNLSPRFMKELLDAMSDNYSKWLTREGIKNLPEGGYQGAYIADIAAGLGLGPDAPADEWRRRGAAAMIEDIKRTLGRFRASFDNWFLERSLYEDGSVDRAIDAVRAGGHTYEREGALWLRSSDFGDDKDRVIVRSDGSPTYIAGDLAYLVSKLERGYDTAVYVLGADHHGYIGRLKAAAAALGYDPDRIDIQIYQFVKIVEGGRAVSASKRRGAVLMLDELLDAIGVDAARYALVQRSHDQVIELDLELWSAQNNENPVYYCQYAHARIAGILRNAGSEPPAAADPDWTPEPPEAELAKALADFPALVAEAAERRGPHRIAGYAQDTAKVFHQFYKQCRVLGAPPAVERSRLALCSATRRVIATALDLVGVEAPDSM